ncbi:dihydrolipoyl dehydrogenase [Paenibacillus sp. N1-5-1-14]|uniref:dihydrolipoyl dehydrogenase n=1 Tax=Paenibacillus radicibacter TaxID=2972488 RepID=UPI0021591D4A|nr:dihydrolipoyl dehydrogenase [Paenibacillus radicibacter]MCR8641812.1 dihydrolipoyl dehydrogenase [Paenibacillus radicibacter]
MVVGEIAVETDVVVIGGGPGGYAAAIRLGQLGKSVILIEKESLGGVCLNHGCIPSKSLIHAAEQFHKLDQLDKMGIHLPEGKAHFDMSGWQGWKDNTIQTLQKGIAHLCERNNVTVVKGHATFFSKDRIGVETKADFQTFKFQQAIVATGSRPFIPREIEIDGKYVLDSSVALQLMELPKRLSIIGGGYIGMELGMAYAKLGCHVTIIEMAERILPQVSAHLVKEVEKQAKKLGMVIHTSTKVEQSVVQDNQVTLHVNAIGSQRTDTVVSDKVLVTIGRTPNTEHLGLDQLGVHVDGRGYVPVNAQCRTNVPHLYAIGDITPGVALAHRAAKQGVIAAEVIGGRSSAMDSAFIPYVIFTEPQIAGVGLTREEAEQRGYLIKVGQFPYRANGRALATDCSAGFAEVIVDAQSHILLGMHVVGADASNLISEGILALELAARVEDLSLTIHPHPTLSEVWLEAAEAALGHAIHVVNKEHSIL